MPPPPAPSGISASEALNADVPAQLFAWLQGNVALLALVVLPLLGLFFWLRWRLGAAARNAARARSKGAAGEAVARKLLRAHGFRVLREQVHAKAEVFVDGESVQQPLRADFLVARGRRRYIADAKSGAKATSLRHAPTRRQLLEYQHSYDVDGVLLIDTERSRIHHVRFVRRTNGFRHGLWLGLLLGLFAAFAFAFFTTGGLGSAGG